MADLKRK